MAIEKTGVIGAFISDDFYFFFEEKDIKTLEQKKMVKGTFACYNNKSPKKPLHMELVVSILKKSKKLTKTDIIISFSKNQICFYITEDHFEEWFVNPSDWVRENGPNWRCCTTNVYITRGVSKKSSVRKAELLNFISQAE